jgi:carbonic anhydrase
MADKEKHQDKPWSPEGTTTDDIVLMDATERNAKPPPIDTAEPIISPTGKRVQLDTQSPGWISATSEGNDSHSDDENSNRKMTRLRSHSTLFLLDEKAALEEAEAIKAAHHHSEEPPYSPRPMTNPTPEELANFKHKLLRGNQIFVNKQLKLDPEYFNRLAKAQHPHTLWIGCSDARIPTDTITRTVPGEIFVHRNIANTVLHTDFNLLSVLHYAVDFLHVKQVVVCGHYGCGGIHASLQDPLPHGIIENWLLQIQQTYRLHKHELEKVQDPFLKECLLVEKHVVEGVLGVAATSIIQGAWARRKDKPYPHIHGLVYGLKDGTLKDVFSITDPSQLRGYIHTVKM